MVRFAKLFGRASAPPRVDRVVVGLGNPGEGYATTRHNVGFQVASRLAKRARAEFALKAADSRIAEGAIDGLRLAIARPQTFMNDSGRAIRKLLDRYRIEPDALFVVYDDIDLPLGKLRLREKGGPGTHNGMRSVVRELDSDDVPRLRIGISQAQPGAATDHVLSEFSPEQQTAVADLIHRAADAAFAWAHEGAVVAMNRYNRG
jgi:PTH1 family peptidyl-tRNA hydrolase